MVSSYPLPLLFVAMETAIHVAFERSAEKEDIVFLSVHDALVLPSHIKQRVPGMTSHLPASHECWESQIPTPFISSHSSPSLLSAPPSLFSWYFLLVTILNKDTFNKIWRCSTSYGDKSDNWVRMPCCTLQVVNMHVSTRVIKKKKKSTLLDKTLYLKTSTFTV